jgi:hypothetical protein
MNITQYIFDDYVIQVKPGKITITDGETIWVSTQSYKSAIPKTVSVQNQEKIIEEALYSTDRVKFKFEFHPEISSLYIYFKVQDKDIYYLGAKFKFEEDTNKSTMMNLFKVYETKLTQCEKLTNYLEKLADERNEAIELAKKTILEKDNLEKQLYTSFVHILNEKKRKIRSMEVKSPVRLPTPSLSLTPRSLSSQEILENLMRD